MATKNFNNLFSLIIICIESKCPGANSEMEGFILGGDDTTISKFPHSVFLSINCYGSWICGSSILNQNTVLTAAHCLSGCDKNMKVHAFAGSENLKKMKSVRDIFKIVIHADYDEDMVINDIALGHLKRSFVLGNTIKRVIIKNYKPKNPNAQVAGWGIINEVTQEEPVILKEAKQKFRTLESCFKIGKLLPGMLCAESVSTKISRPASGDSGSALIDSHFQQIGLVSFRIDLFPRIVIYTDVSYYYDWLKTNLKRLSCSGK